MGIGGVACRPLRRRLPSTNTESAGSRRLEGSWFPPQCSGRPRWRLMLPRSPATRAREIPVAANIARWPPRYQQRQPRLASCFSPHALKCAVPAPSRIRPSWRKPGHPRMKLPKLEVPPVRTFCLPLRKKGASFPGVAGARPLSRFGCIRSPGTDWQPAVRPPALEHGLSPPERAARFARIKRAGPHTTRQNTEKGIEMKLKPQPDTSCRIHAGGGPFGGARPPGAQ